MNFPNNINFEMNEFQRTIHSYTRRLKFTQSGLKTAWKKDIDGEEPLWLCSRLSFLMNAHFTTVQSEKLLQSSKAFKTGTISETSVWPPYSNDSPKSLCSSVLIASKLPVLPKTAQLRAEQKNQKKSSEKTETELLRWWSDCYSHPELGDCYDSLWISGQIVKTFTECICTDFKLSGDWRVNGFNLRLTWN